MDITLKIGTRSETVQVPEANLQGILTPNEVSVALTGEAEVWRALNEPIGTPRLRDIVHPGEKIAIITSDITRPMPTWKVMPALLDELYDAGVKREDVTLVFALGSHRCHTEEEQRHLAGDRAWSEITCVDGNTADCVHIGVTSRGTPVDIVRTVAEADRRICLGNIEYHYLPVIPAVPRPSCPAFLPGRRFRPTTAAWWRKLPMPASWRATPSGRILRRPPPWWGWTSS